MNIELIFRGLNKCGIWIYGLPFLSHDTGEYFITHSDGWIPTYNDPDSGESTIKTLVKRNTVGQYTGLKDKNGKRIFEGDLLRLPPADEWENKNFSSFEVFFHSNDCTPTDCGLVLGRMKCYGAVAGGYGGYKLIPRDVGRMVVIGNIHENPELLK